MRSSPGSTGREAAGSSPNGEGARRSWDGPRSTTLPSLARADQTPLQEPPFLWVRDQLEGSLVGGGRLFEAGEAAKQISASGMEQVIAVQCLGEWLEGPQTPVRAVRHGHGHRPVELDDR